MGGPTPSAQQQNEAREDRTALTRQRIEDAFRRLNPPPGQEEKVRLAARLYAGMAKHLSYARPVTMGPLFLGSSGKKKGRSEPRRGGRPVKMGRSRTPNTPALTVVRNLAADYRAIMGQEPTVSTDPYGQRCGRFADLVGAVFGAMGINAEPGEMARRAVKYWRKNRDEIKRAAADQAEYLIADAKKLGLF
jgi:hypothetical protein